MARSGASRGAKNTNSFDEQDTKNASGQRLAHANKAGTAHSGGADHDFMHGRRGTNTWPDGRRKVPVEQLKKQNNELRKELGYSEQQWIQEFGNTGGNQISKKKTKNSYG